MTIKASGLWALVLATGLWMCLAGSSQAQSTDNTAAASNSDSATEATTAAPTKAAKQSSRHSKSEANLKVSKEEPKSSADKKAAVTGAASKGGDNSNRIVPSVANANAQLTAADAPEARNNDTSQAAPDTSGVQPTADQMVAPDQLNEIDRALPTNAPVAPISATARPPRRSRR